MDIGITIFFVLVGIGIFAICFARAMDIIENPKKKVICCESCKKINKERKRK